MVFCRRKNANTQRPAARILSIVLNTTDLIANRDCMNFKNDLGRQSCSLADFWSANYCPIKGGESNKTMHQTPSDQWQSHQRYFQIPSSDSTIYEPRKNEPVKISPSGWCARSFRWKNCQVLIGNKLHFQFLKIGHRTQWTADGRNRKEL